MRQGIFGARAVLIAALSTTIILAVSANAEGAKSLSRNTLPPGFASGADVESVEYIFSALKGAKYPADVEKNLLADVERYSKGVVDEKFTPPILLNVFTPYPAFVSEMQKRQKISDFEAAKYACAFAYKYLLYGWMPPQKGKGRFDFNYISKAPVESLYGDITIHNGMGVCSEYSALCVRLLSVVGIKAAVVFAGIRSASGDERGHVYIVARVKTHSGYVYTPMDPTSNVCWLTSSRAPADLFSMMAAERKTHKLTDYTDAPLEPGAIGKFAQPGRGIVISPDFQFVYTPDMDGFSPCAVNSYRYGKFYVLPSARTYAAWKRLRSVAETYIRYDGEMGHEGTWEDFIFNAGLKPVDWIAGKPTGLVADPDTLDQFIKAYQAFAAGQPQ